MKTVNRDETQLRAEIQELESALRKKHRALSALVKERESRLTKRFWAWQENKDAQRRAKLDEM